VATAATTAAAEGTADVTVAAIAAAAAGAAAKATAAAAAAAAAADTVDATGTKGAISNARVAQAKAATAYEKVAAATAKTKVPAEGRALLGYTSARRLAASAAEQRTAAATAAAMEGASIDTAEVAAEAAATEAEETADYLTAAITTPTADVVAEVLAAAQRTAAAAVEARRAADAIFLPLPDGLRVLVALMTADRAVLGPVPVEPPTGILVFQVPPAMLVVETPNPDAWKGVITVHGPAGGWKNIGSGSFSDVYEAPYWHDGASTVVKRYRHPINSVGSLWREACAYKKLEAARVSAPRLIGGMWKEAGADGRRVLATLLLSPRGEPLLDALRRIPDDGTCGSTLQRWTVAVRAADAVLGALVQAHEHHYLHDDIRLANVVLLGAAGGGGGGGAAGGAAAGGAGGGGARGAQPFAQLVDWGRAKLGSTTKKEGAGEDASAEKDAWMAAQLVRAAFGHIRRAGDEGSPEPDYLAPLCAADETAHGLADGFLKTYLTRQNHSAETVQRNLQPLLKQLARAGPCGRCSSCGAAAGTGAAAGGGAAVGAGAAAAAAGGAGVAPRVR